MKTCSKCKISKNLSDFYKCNSSKDSLNYKCKSCVREYKSKYSKSKNKNLRILGKCVYLHKNPKTNEVFYVGIGTEKRPFDFKNRNFFWRNYYLKHGIKVCIIERGLSIEEAYLKEVKLITLYGRRNLNKGSLVNLTNGGEGSSKNRRYEDSKKCICLITGIVYDSVMSYCKENKLSYNAVVQFLKTTEQGKVEYRIKPHSVRLLKKNNTIVWDYSEKLNINSEYHCLDSQKELYYEDVNYKNLEIILENKINLLKKEGIIGVYKKKYKTFYLSIFEDIYYGYSYDEICEITGLSYHYIYGIYNRYKKDIKNYIIENYEDCYLE
tara:strand:+ start:37 stop:1008 length:972 start_codon:yes stop_codon:yes gene_type:complete